MSSITMIQNRETLGATSAQVTVQELLDTVSKNSTTLYRRAYRLLRNAADAEDAVQEALLSACKHLDTFQGQARLSTWLTTIVANAARQSLRRRPRQTHVSIDQPLRDRDMKSALELVELGSTPEQDCIRRELRVMLSQSALKLSPASRKAYELRDIDGLTTREAARALGISESALKAHLTRARNRIKELMSARIA